MIDRLWIVKFVSMFPLPGNAINAAFDSEEKAKEVFDRHAKLLSGKLDDAMETLVFEDLIGHRCLRSSYFPYSDMVEVGPCDIAQMEINKRIEASHKAAGFIKGDVGFKGEKPEADPPLEKAIETAKLKTDS